MAQYDYVVIGAGSAGCVVANRLTEEGETTVLLLEAGNPATKPEIQVPLAWTSLLGTEVDWDISQNPNRISMDAKFFRHAAKLSVDLVRLMR
jgi:choline dehydrogenase